MSERRWHHALWLHYGLTQLALQKALIREIVKDKCDEVYKLFNQRIKINSFFCKRKSALVCTSKFQSHLSLFGSLTFLVIALLRCCKTLFTTTRQSLRSVRARTFLVYILTCVMIRLDSSLCDLFLLYLAVYTYKVHKCLDQLRW